MDEGPFFVVERFKRKREAVIAVGEVRVYLKRLPVIKDGLRQVALVEVDKAEVVIDLGDIGVEPYRCLILRDSLVKPASVRIFKAPFKTDLRLVERAMRLGKGRQEQAKRDYQRSYSHNCLGRRLARDTQGAAGAGPETGLPSYPAMLP